jgi:hypothetical protein
VKPKLSNKIHHIITFANRISIQGRSSGCGLIANGNILEKISKPIKDEIVQHKSNVASSKF